MFQDEEVRFFVFIGVGVFLALILFIVFFIVYYYKRQLLFFKEKQELTSRFQQEILQAQIEIQEQTLKNISQEIHDNIGQTLSLAKLNLNTVDLTLTNRVEEKIVKSKDLVSKAIHDLRNLSRSLNTDSLIAAGLVKGVETELSLIENAGAFQTELIVNGTMVRIDPKKELILFRLVQEAINNIIKHADANRVTVDINFGESILRISISDNGKGFDQSEKIEGSGLRNMNNRAELIGGSFIVNTNPGGTMVIVSIPM